MGAKRQTPPSDYVTLGYLRPIFDYMRKHDEPVEPYLQQLGIEEDDLLNADLRVADADFDQLFRIAEQRLGDSNIGLHIGQSMQFQHLGIIGMLIMNCRYVHEVFDLHARYGGLVGNGLVTRYTVQDDVCCMETRRLEGARPYCRHTYEYSFGGWWNLKSLIVGDRLQPSHIELPYPAPPVTSEHHAVYAGIPLSYGHEVLRVYFSAAYRDLALMAADSQLKQVLEAQALQRLHELQGEQADRDPFVARVRQMIADRLAYGVPSVEEIAGELNVSVRTLQRQLDSGDSGYKALLDLVRADLAQKYINNRALSLLDVAMMLGFAEQSSFQRAFKRWFGNTPGEYRRQQGRFIAT